MNFFEKAITGIMKGDYKKSKTKPSIKIIVAGTDYGVGVTHFSILMGNYYRSILKKKVAIVDMNKNEDYINLKKYGKIGTIPETFIINNVIYYPKATKNLLEEILSEDYECIIFDVGTLYNKYKVEACMCDKRFMLMSASRWKIPFSWNYDYEENAKITGNTDYNINEWQRLFVFGSKEYEKYMKRIPFIENPFKVNREILGEVSKVIGEE